MARLRGMGESMNRWEVVTIVRKEGMREGREPAAWHATDEGRGSLIEEDITTSA